MGTRLAIAMLLSAMTFGPFPSQSLTVYLLGQTQCGPQEFKDPNQSPFAFDPNLLVIDPVSRKPLLLGSVIAEVGTTLRITADYCDPDGDDVTFEPSSDYTLTVDPNALKYTIEVRETEVGFKAYTVGVTDRPLVGSPYTRRGTFVVAWVRNNAPILGCLSTGR